MSEAIALAATASGMVDSEPQPIEAETVELVHGLAETLTGADRALAEDLAQDLLLRIVEGLQPPEGALRPWLIRCLRSRLINSRHAERFRFALPLDSEIVECTADQWPDRLVASADLSRRVRERVQGLPDLYRDVIHMRFLEGETPSEIAVELGASASTVRTRLRRGLEHLRRHRN